MRKIPFRISQSIAYPFTHRSEIIDTVENFISVAPRSGFFFFTYVPEAGPDSSGGGKLAGIEPVASGTAGNPAKAPNDVERVAGAFRRAYGCLLRLATYSSVHNAISHPHIPQAIARKRYRAIHFTMFQIPTMPIPVATRKPSAVSSPVRIMTGAM